MSSRKTRVAQQNAALSPQSVENTTDFIGLRLGVGESIRVECRAPQRRFVLNYWGTQVGQALLLSMPARNGQFMPLADDTPLTLRFIAGNYACACTSQVIRSVLQPLPLLVARYPERVEAVQIRKATRLKTALVVSVDGGDALATSHHWPCQAFCRDLSLDGALLESHDLLADVGATLFVTARLPVAEFDQLVLLEAQVRNLEESETDGRYRVRHGVSFKQLDEETRLVLTAFVYQEMLYEQRAI